MSGYKIVMTPEQLAQKFHEAYERLAPSHGYETRKESAKPWAEVPPNNKSLMTAVCAEMLAELKSHVREVTIAEALAECRKWKLSDSEVEEILK